MMCDGFTFAPDNTRSYAQRLSPAIRLSVTYRGGMLVRVHRGPLLTARSTCRRRFRYCKSGRWPCPNFIVQSSRGTEQAATLADARELDMTRVAESAHYGKLDGAVVL